MLCHDFRIDFNFNPRSYKRSDEVDQWVRLSDVEISIHAPTRGATFGRLIRMWVGKVISIHAPTRGATAKMHNNPYTYL